VCIFGRVFEHDMSPGLDNSQQEPSNVSY